MASFPSLPLFVKDYLVDTVALTLEQSGAYLHLLMHAWLRGGALPDDNRQLAAFCKVSMKKWAAIRPYLEPFFTVENGQWVNARLSREWRYVRGISEKRASAGAIGAAARASKNSDLAKQMLKPGLSKAQALRLTLTSVSKDTAENGVSADPAKVVFDAGVRLLREAGKSDGQARALVGKWRRDHGDEALIAALGKAQREGAIDPVSFVEGCLRAARRARDDGSSVARVGF